MRITLNINDDSYTHASEIYGVKNITALIHEGLHVLIQRESAHRLATLGATEPNLTRPTRRPSTPP